MEQTYTPLSVRDIDNNIEGKPLSESEIRLFEESYQKYIDDSKENKEKLTSVYSKASYFFIRLLFLQMKDGRFLNRWCVLFNLPDNTLSDLQRKSA